MHTMPKTQAEWNKLYVSQWKNVLLTPDPEHGGLRMTLTPWGREYLAERREQYPNWSDDDLFFDLIEDMLGNGWMSINPDTVALCSIPILLTPDGDMDDDGNVTGELVFAHTNYATELACEALESEAGLLLFEAGPVTKRTDA